MRITSAIILAAGRGTRLGRLGTELPKGLIRLGSRPLIEESVNKLVTAGISKIIIVTGHLADQFFYLEDRYPGIVCLIYNRDYLEAGSLRSLCIGGVNISEDFLLLESDLIYEQSALEVLIQSEHSNAILLKQSTGLTDELFVEVDNGLLKRVSKHRDDIRGQIAGVYTGLFRLSQSLFHSTAAVAAEEYREVTKLSHGTFLVRMARDHSIHCITRDVLCLEIDDAKHLEFARNHYPKILAQDHVKNSSTS